MKTEILRLADRIAVADEAIARFSAAARSAIRARGRFVVALTGGSTPVTLYQRLAALPPDAIPWRQCLLFFGDERCVPPEHEWSNYRLAQESLLDHIPVPQENIFRMHGEDVPEAAAAAYTGKLRAALGANWPRLDLVLLGIGEDGHTASLFPGMPALTVAEFAAIATPVPGYVQPQVSRLTMTFPLLNAARQVIFLAAGENKLQAVRAALKPERDTVLVPAARIRPDPGHLTWLLDRAATPSELAV